VTLAKLAKLATICAAAQGAANGGVTLGTVEQVVVDLVVNPALDTGRWALLLAQLPFSMANSTGSTQAINLTMRVRSGGTAGQPDGTVVVDEVCGLSAITGQTMPAMASSIFLLSPSSAVSRLKLTSIQGSSSVSVTTQWRPRLLVLQFA
jgi:hypothetical protein